MRLGRLTHIAQVGGVDVYVHWTVFLIIVILLLETPRRPLTIVTGLAAYLGLLILHESGHMIVARLKGYNTFSIALYPVFGLASLQRPDSRFDRALIAWGGVAAQAAVAIPLVVCTAILGYSPYEALNAMLIILGSYSLFAAAFNLLPVRPLDGSVAWDLVPAYFELRRMRKGPGVPAYKGSR